MNGSEISHEFNKQARLLLKQSVKKIEHCLRQIDHNQCWWRPGDGLNSIGNLVLHINGNLRQWAVAGLTQQADLRDRASEFAVDNGASIDDLRQLTRDTVARADLVIQKIEPGRLTQQITIQGFEVTVMQAILHTAVHFQGHTHQIIMLTRMQLGDSYQFEWSPDAERGELPM